MSPEQRRAALVEATLELLRHHGRGVTTRQIATAAGVAEGTIFRVFESKDTLVDAAIARAFVPGAVAEQLAAIDPALPFEERMVEVAAILQRRYRSTFELMGQLGLLAPPPGAEATGDRRHRLEGLLELIVEVIGADAADLTVPADELAHRLRLLVFIGSHPTLADGRPLTPEQAVDTVLHGLHRPGRS
ncbi:TetR/AcrR family transcriptional regulator [Nocardioides sp. zg-DK7169]|nr:TetR/AcrR family transcriptional regulator [Nocardioides sp. zg-DK7169]